jgi:hypothetical protein
MNKYTQSEFGSDVDWPEVLHVSRIEEHESYC